MDVELGGGCHKLASRSVDRDTEALESPDLGRIGERESHALLRARLAGKLAAAVSENTFVGVAGQKLIKFAGKIAVAVIAHAIERRSTAPETAEPLRYDMFDPSKPGRVRLGAINANLVVRHAMGVPFPAA